MIIEFDIPQVEEYPDGFPQYWLKLVFHGSLSGNYELKALTTTYIRLTEAALIEYRLGETELRKFWDTHDSFMLSARNRSISHFESCISNMRRAIKCHGALQAYSALPDELEAILGSGTHIFSSDGTAKRIVDFRNQIYHIEERLTSGKIAVGQPHATNPDGPEVSHPTEPSQTIKTINRLEIGGLQMTFGEIAKWLSEMGHVAAEIAERLPPRAKE